MSGRAIRPLKTINDTVEVIADSNLHQRIRMTGPMDERKRLADTFDAMLERSTGPSTDNADSSATPPTSSGHLWRSAEP